MPKPLLTVLTGLPGTGKSTLAKQMQAADPDLFVYSTDAVLDEYAAETGKSYSEMFYTRLHEAQAEMERRLEAAVLAGRNIAWDQINLGLAKRAAVIDRFDHCGALAYDTASVCIAIDDEAEWRRRIDARGPERYVPESALAEMRRRLVEPNVTEGFGSVEILDLRGRQLRRFASRAVGRAKVMAEMVADAKWEVVNRTVREIDDADLDELARGEYRDLSLADWQQYAGGLLWKRFKFWFEEENGCGWNDVAPALNYRLGNFYQRKLWHRIESAWSAARPYG